MLANWLFLPILFSLIIGIYFQNQNTRLIVDNLILTVKEIQTKVDKISIYSSLISELKPSSITSTSSTNNKPIALINGVSIKKDNPAHLIHVHNVFQRIGYQVILGIDSDIKNNQFDVFWNHEYPFMNQKTKHLVNNPYKNQRINHIPGSGYYTSKVQLATANLSLGVPLAFALPQQKQDFLDYSKKNPSVKWVQKSNAHRNIKVLATKDIELDKKDTFVQKFIENPLLIDKKKFDIGIYTVITSISPLKVYIYEGDALIRFCSKDYDPFDSEDVDKYVVGDDYTPVWKMPSLKKYYNDKQLTFKETLNVYLKLKEIDSETIWSQIREIIREVFESQQLNMLSSAKNYKNTGLYFELSRFDFVVDSDLNVYLMEANMSPNLSTGHFKENRLLYEQVIYNVLSLIGLSNRLNNEYIDDNDSIEMQVSDRDILLSLDECVIHDTCNKCDIKNKVICNLCSECMTTDMKKTLKNTYLETVNRRQMRRILPRTFEGESNSMDINTKVLSLWLEQKCQQNSIFCE